MVQYWCCIFTLFQPVCGCELIIRKILGNVYRILTYRALFMQVICLTILSMLTFLVPPDAGEKLGTGITVLLAFSVFMMLFAEYTPQASINVPVIGEICDITKSKS